MPYIADIYGKRVDNFFKNIDINNRISLEVFYEIFQFGNKSIFFLTFLDENTLQYPNLFLDYKNVDSDGVIRRECGQTLGLGLVDRNRTVVNY